MAEITSGRPLVVRGHRHAAPGRGLVLLGGIVCVAFVTALALGPTGVHLPFVGNGTSSDRFVLEAIRLPRAVAAAACGGALAVAGAAMQAVMRNPLADAGLTGVTPGATLGAVLAIVGGGLAPSLQPVLTHPLGIVLAAFLGGMTVTLVLLHLSRRYGRGDLASMLLAGLAIAALSGALTGLAIATASDSQLRDFTFWSLGSLSGTDRTRVLWALPVLLVGMAGLLRLGRNLNRLSLGDAQAFHLGEPVARTRRIVIALVAASSGASVAITGGIGFVGIIVPHLARLAFGADNRVLLPVSALGGAVFLLVCDTIARLIVMPAELPLGILTALLGAPVFLWLLFKVSRSV